MKPPNPVQSVPLLLSLSACKRLARRLLSRPLDRRGRWEGEKARGQALLPIYSSQDKYPAATHLASFNSPPGSLKPTSTLSPFLAFHRGPKSSLATNKWRAGSLHPPSLKPCQRLHLILKPQSIASLQHSRSRRLLHFSSHGRQEKSHQFTPSRPLPRELSNSPSTLPLRPTLILSSTQYQCPLSTM